MGVDYHNDGHTHIDALCHVAYDGSLYNGRPQEAVSKAGAAVDAIEVLANGLVARGVLLDVPRLRGIRWLEPGEHVFREQLEAAELEQGVVLREGDVLLVRTGHARRLRRAGTVGDGHREGGAAPDRDAVRSRSAGSRSLGCDGNSDTAPSSTEGVAFPIHVLALNAMGVHLLDYLQLEDLSAVCEQKGRWEFLLAAAPLRIQGGTGSPLNPIAIF